MTASASIPVADVTGAAPLASPTFSGTPSLPTGTTGVTQTALTNNTTLATTAYADAAVTGKQNTLTNSAGLAGALADETGTGLAVFATSPTFSGTPSLPTGTTGVTQTAGNNTTALATTQFVTSAVAAVASTVRLNSDEFTATAAQTTFTFTTATSNTGAVQTPLSKPYMFINGTRIKNSAYTWTSGTTVTYIPANNNSYALVVGDRIQFDYAY
jgi:hypothetical protein